MPFFDMRLLLRMVLLSVPFMSPMRSVLEFMVPLVVVPLFIEPLFMVPEGVVEPELVGVV